MHRYLQIRCLGYLLGADDSLSIMNEKAFFKYKVSPELRNWKGRRFYLFVLLKRERFLYSMSISNSWTLTFQLWILFHGQALMGRVPGDVNYRIETCSCVMSQFGLKQREGGQATCLGDWENLKSRLDAENLIGKPPFTGLPTESSW